MTPEDATVEARRTILGLITGYRASERRMALWARYPYLTEKEDRETDTFACEEVSDAFARYAFKRGHRALVLVCTEPENPIAGNHTWVRFPDLGDNGIDVDLTGRQFYNLESPPNPEHADLPWALVWPSDGTFHPITGRYRQAIGTLLDPQLQPGGTP